jgi:hypothetical protein
MVSLHKTLLEKCKKGYVKLSELKPHSREIAQRLLADGELYVDERGHLRSNSK